MYCLKYKINSPWLEWLGQNGKEFIVDLVVSAKTISVNDERVLHIETAPGLSYDIPKKYIIEIKKSNKPFYSSTKLKGGDGDNVEFIDKEFLRSYIYSKKKGAIGERWSKKKSFEATRNPAEGEIMIKVFQISKYTDEYELWHTHKSKDTPVLTMKLPHITRIAGGLPAFFAGAGNVYYVARGWRNLGGVIEDFMDLVPRNLFKAYVDERKKTPANKQYKENTITYIAQGTKFSMNRWFFNQKSDNKDDKSTIDRRAIPITGSDPEIAIRIRGHRVGDQKLYSIMTKPTTEPVFTFYQVLDDPEKEKTTIRTCCLTPSNGKPEENIAETGKPFSKELYTVERYDLHTIDDKRLQGMVVQYGDSIRGQWNVPIFMGKGYKDAALDLPGNNVFAIINWDPQNKDYPTTIGNDTAWISESAAFRIIADRTKVKRIMWHPEVPAFFVSPRGEIIDSSLFSNINWDMYTGVGNELKDGQVLFVVGCTPLEYDAMKEDKKTVSVHTVKLPKKISATIAKIDIDVIDRDDTLYRIIAIKYDWSVPCRPGTKFAAHGRKWSVAGIVPDRFMYVIGKDGVRRSVDMIFRPKFKGNSGLAFLSEMAMNHKLIADGVDPLACTCDITDTNDIVEVDTMDTEFIKSAPDYVKENMLFDGHLKVKLDGVKKTDFSCKGVVAGYVRVVRVSDEDIVDKVSSEYTNHIGIINNPLHLNSTALFTIFAHVGFENRELVFDWMKQIRDPQWNTYFKDIRYALDMVAPKVGKDGKQLSTRLGQEIPTNVQWYTKKQARVIAKKLGQSAAFLNTPRVFDNQLDVATLKQGGLIGTIIDDKYDNHALFVLVNNEKYLYVPELAKDHLGLDTGLIVANPLARAFNRFIDKLTSHLAKPKAFFPSFYLKREYFKFADAIAEEHHKVARHMYRNPVSAGLMSRMTGWAGLAIDEVGIGRNKLLAMVMNSKIVRDMYGININNLTLDKESVNKELAKIDYVLAVKYPVHRYDARIMKVKMMHSNRISINPMTASVFNGDFDGDLIQVFPLTKELRKPEFVKALGITADNPYLLPAEDRTELVNVDDMVETTEPMVRDVAYSASEKMFQKVAVGLFASFGIRVGYLLFDRWIAGTATDEEVCEYLERFYRSSYEDFVQKDAKADWQALIKFWNSAMENKGAYNKQGIIDVFKGLEIDGYEVLEHLLPDNETVGESSFYGWINQVHPFAGLTARSCPRWEDYHGRVNYFMSLDVNDFWRRLLSHR